MSVKIKILIAYFVLISVFSAVLTVIDKRNARLNRRRISEKALFLSAIFGGSAFEYITMKAIRHKTLHKRFMLGLPVIFLLQITLIVFLYIKLIKTGIINL